MRTDRLSEINQKARIKRQPRGRVSAVPALRLWCLLASLPLCLCCLVVLFGPVAGAALQAGESHRAHLRHSDADPDGDRPLMILPPQASVAVQADECRSFGDFVRLFAGSNRYRGNVFSMDRSYLSCFISDALNHDGHLRQVF